MPTQSLLRRGSLCMSLALNFPIVVTSPEWIGFSGYSRPSYKTADLTEDSACNTAALQAMVKCTVSPKPQRWTKHFKG